MKSMLHTLVATLLLTLSIATNASSKIGILVFDGFLTSDVTAPIEVFGAATKKAWFSSYEVVVISVTENKAVTSEEGLNIMADKTIYDELELDVLIAPSAYDMDDLVENEDLIGFIRDQGRSASWLASNCSGVFLLGEAGALDGKKATTWAGGEKRLARAFPKADIQYDKTVVVDSNIITSNGGPVSYLAAFELLAKLSSEDFAREISATIQFDRLERAF